MHVHRPQKQDTDVRTYVCTHVLCCKSVRLEICPVPGVGDWRIDSLPHDVIAQRGTYLHSSVELANYWSHCAVRPFQGMPPLVSSTGQLASRSNHATTQWWLVNSFQISNGVKWTFHCHHCTSCHSHHLCCTITQTRLWNSKSVESIFPLLMETVTIVEEVELTLVVRLWGRIDLPVHLWGTNITWWTVLFCCHC